MSFDLLVKDAAPALAIVEGKATEGRSWDFGPIGIYDSNDDPVDLTGVTAQARAFDAIDGTLLLTFTVTIGGTDNNEVTLTATPTDTAGKAGDSKRPRICPWHLTLTNAASRKVDAWGVQDSVLIISQGA